MNWITRLLLPLFLLPFLTPHLHAADALATDAEIKTLSQKRIETGKQTGGIVVGIVDEKGARVIACGTNGQGGALDGETMFEIGSVTKVFTALILADMVEQGEVKLDDPIAKYLPATVKIAGRKDRVITLVDLVTHSSGLPPLPDNLAPADPKNPYADYTVEQMYEFLNGWKPKRDIGAKYEYSNLGGGLLGHVLALQAGTNYEALVKQRICGPLGMTNTVITLSPGQRARLAPGHYAQGQPAPNWDLPTLAGAGALRSTVHDLLKLVSANMGQTKTALQPAMDLAQTPRRSAWSAATKIGLGWHITTGYGAAIVWHNGSTGGYYSFIGFDRKKQLGVVVLSNQALGVDDLGLHILNDKFPLLKAEPHTNHAAIALDSAILNGYVGQYAFDGGILYSVRPHGNHLEAQLTGQPYADIFPETRTRFFYKEVDAQITFHNAADGEPAFLVLHQNGVDQIAKKISDQVPRGHAAIPLDPKLYDAYAGRYELTPDAAFTVRRSGDHLMAQLTGQPAFEIFPESATEFFYKVVEAQLIFEKDAQGKITGLILRQNETEQKAKKVK